MITRSQIINCTKQVLIWFNNNEININNKVKYILRNDKYTVDYDHLINLLNNICFFYNDIDCHWQKQMVKRYI